MGFLDHDTFIIWIASGKIQKKGSHRGSIGQQYTGSYQRSHHTPGHVYGIDEPRIAMSSLQRRDEDICVCIVKRLPALLWQRTSINVHQSVVWRDHPSGKRIRFQIRPIGHPITKRFEKFHALRHITTSISKFV